ncbi:MAG: hypothetical protein EH225_09155 [Calditrichaeota bacterium]|nr:hypothetical protein [Calditrichota bacterium]RQW01871.1 MAG: hypothetical protein EH225_09155 [Calditrichota bacterium]
MSKRAKRLQRISRRLTTHQLRRLQDKDVDLGIGNLFQSQESRGGSPYFLGYYSPSGIRYALERYGFFDILKQKGFEDLKLTINTKDPYKQRIAIHYQQKDPDHMLGELVVKKRHITIYPPFPSLIYGRNFEVIAVEWLCMQNPKGDFSEDRPRLPGQKYPGLGMGEVVMEILIIMCGRLRTAGLLNTPEHFHNAQMYSSHFRYIDPVEEGKRLAIVRDLLSTYKMPEISWAIDMNCVLMNDRKFEWKGSEQIIPLDRDLQEYFNDPRYLAIVEETLASSHFRLDEEKWQQKQGEIDRFITC